MNSVSLEQKQFKIFNQLKQVLNNQKLSHAYLFNGLKEYGTIEMAYFMAQAIFCEHGSNQLPCQQCMNCQNIANQLFLNVEHIQPEGSHIKVEQIRGLKNQLNYSNLSDTKKVYIIENAESLTISATNSLLKFLEEPHNEVYFFLLTENKQLILPTLLSRVQIFDFDKLNREVLYTLLVQENISEAKCQLLSYLVNSVAEAKNLLEKENSDAFFKDIAYFIQLLLEKDQMVFVSVQKQLAPYLNDKVYVSILCDFMTLYCRDNYFCYHNQQDKMYFPLYLEKYKQTKIKVDLSDNILKFRTYIKANVSVQSALELLCTEVLLD